MINVLSLFDGLGGARIALDQLGIECNYYASEVDKYAIKVAKANYPDIKHIGDVRGVFGKYLPPIDLIIGGSPCQDLSVAKSGREGLDGERSGLFWEYVRILKECEPKYFLLENVYSMPKESMKIISKVMGCSPIPINSALLTAQNRKRYYWTNTGVWMQPQDQGIVLADIIEDGAVDRDKSYCLTATYRMDGLKYYRERKQRQVVFKEKSGTIQSTIYKENVKSMIKRNKLGLLVKGCAKRTREGTKELEIREDDKANSITTVQSDSMIYTIPRGYNKGGVRKTEKAPTVTSNAFEHNNFLYTQEGIRKLTPLECERLQGIPDNYTNHVSNTQRYKMIGNGFTIPVIKYILSHADFATPHNPT